MDNLVMIGFMGSGKGAAASELARRLNLPVIDIDKKVSECMKMPSAEIYKRFGEAYYRAMEYFVLDLLSSSNMKAVIVLGSGALTLQNNIDCVKKLGKVCYIEREFESLLENMKQSDKKHAWIRSTEWENQVRKLFKERKDGYEQTADVTIKADGKTPDEIVNEILA